MKIAISNIAWDLPEDQEVARLMGEYRISGVEIAPTKVWEAPTETEDSALLDYREWWKGLGINVISMQSLLFGKPDLRIFGDSTTRSQTFSHLSGMIEVGAKLGAKVLVFGSPINRAVVDMEPVEAMDVAIEFFSGLGEVAQSKGICFCIEPNPPDYGCDFVRTAKEGRDLVRRVGSTGFRLHLDAAAMTLNGEDYYASIESSLEWLAHFHISEPNLGVIGKGGTDHLQLSKSLRELGYNNWVSIEMRNGHTTPNTPTVRSALEFVTNVYA